MDARKVLKAAAVVAVIIVVAILGIGNVISTSQTTIANIQSGAGLVALAVLVLALILHMRRNKGEAPASTKPRPEPKPRVVVIKRSRPSGLNQLVAFLEAWARRKLQLADAQEKAAAQGAERGERKAGLLAVRGALAGISTEHLPERLQQELGEAEKMSMGDLAKLIRKIIGALIERVNELAKAPQEKNAELAHRLEETQRLFKESQGRAREAKKNLADAEKRIADERRAAAEALKSANGRAEASEAAWQEAQATIDQLQQQAEASSKTAAQQLGDARTALEAEQQSSARLEEQLTEAQAARSAAEVELSGTQAALERAEKSLRLAEGDLRRLQDHLSSALVAAQAAEVEARGTRTALERAEDGLREAHASVKRLTTQTQELQARLDAVPRWIRFIEELNRALESSSELAAFLTQHASDEEGVKECAFALLALNGGLDRMVKLLGKLAEKANEMANAEDNGDDYDRLLEEQTQICSFLGSAIGQLGLYDWLGRFGEGVRGLILGNAVDGRAWVAKVVLGMYLTDPEQWGWCASEEGGLLEDLDALPLPTREAVFRLQETPERSLLVSLGQPAVRAAIALIKERVSGKPEVRGEGKGRISLPDVRNPDAVRRAIQTASDEDAMVFEAAQRNLDFLLLLNESALRAFVLSFLGTAEKLAAAFKHLHADPRLVFQLLDTSPENLGRLGIDGTHLSGVQAVADLRDPMKEKGISDCLTELLSQIAKERGGRQGIKHVLDARLHQQQLFHSRLLA